MLRDSEAILMLLYVDEGIEQMRLSKKASRPPLATFSKGITPQYTEFAS
jgi:hypothetical protein